MSVQSTFKSLLLFAPFVLSGTTVDYRTYTDDTCETEAVTMSGETGRVTLDLEATCNPTPDSSIDGLECFLGMC